MNPKSLYKLAALSGCALGYLAWQRFNALSLAGRTAVITGGSRGLGLAIAREMARQGAHIVLLARNGAELVSAKEQLDVYGGQVLTLVCDVSDKPSVERCVSSIVSIFGTLDILVNNAGQIQVGPLEDMTEEDFDAAIDVHMRAPLHTMLAVIPHMRNQGEGRIVNIASFGGVIAVPHMAPYSASKFGLVGLSDALRTELAGAGIKVTTVCPGLMRTGSHLHAQFKGRAAKEYGWFTLANDWPIMSIDANEAAQKIVWAARRGTPRLDFTLPARVGRIMASLAPNLTAHSLAFASRLLPSGRGGAGIALHAGSEFAPGQESEREAAAADENNERHS